MSQKKANIVLENLYSLHIYCDFKSNRAAAAFCANNLTWHH